MYVTTIGEENPGSAVFIWLHGWGQDHKAMHRIASLFKLDGKHYLFDLPGFGKSPNPPTGAGTADYADILANKIKSLGTGPFIFIGHSFGGRVSVQMAARHAALVDKIILIAGAGIPKDRSISYKAKAYSLRWLGKVLRLTDKLLKTKFRSAYSQRFGSTDYKAAGDLRPTFVRVVNENLTEQARSVNCPTLLIYGSEDTETPPEIGKKYQAVLPNAQLQIMNGFGHLDILDRGAYQCQAVIKSFLKKTM